VDKLLERIYPKLGVENRTAAVMRLMEFIKEKESEN
jgi:DNA-binding CsgD family transcriptional regulator